MTKKLVGLSVAATAALAAIPASTGAQSLVCPPGTTNPNYCVNADANGVTDATITQETAKGVDALQRALGVSASGVRLVNFNGGRLMVPSNGDAERSELRSARGQLVGVFLCIRVGGCSMGANVRIRMGGRDFYTRKLVRQLAAGQSMEIFAKIPASRRALLNRSTVVRVGTATRLRSPQTGRLHNNAKRLVRLDLL